MERDEAISLDNIELSFKNVRHQTSDDAILSKDRIVEGLEKQLQQKEKLLEYFNVETKKHVLDKTRLVKCLRDADQFLGDLCGRITQGYRRKNDVIISLIKEVEEKNRVVKRLEEAIKDDPNAITKFEENQKELEELRDEIKNKDLVISQQLVKLLTKELQNERVEILEKKIFQQNCEKISMEIDQQENNLKMKQLEIQIQHLQTQNVVLEGNVLSLETTMKREKTRFSWFKEVFRRNNSSNH